MYLKTKLAALFPMVAIALASGAPTAHAADVQVPPGATFCTLTIGTYGSGTSIFASAYSSCDGLSFPMIQDGPYPETSALGLDFQAFVTREVGLFIASHMTITPCPTSSTTYFFCFAKEAAPRSPLR